VPYYRFSTRKQGESGLGLEAQQSCVSNYARTGQHDIIASFQEIETGKRSERPELAKAIARAKRAKATLVIAKLDRFARNVHFLSGLMESKVDFLCCDNPHANRASSVGGSNSVAIQQVRIVWVLRSTWKCMSHSPMIRS